MKANYHDLPTVTPHSRLCLHIQRHKYTKGQHTGAAPADSTRRGKSHFRVAHKFDRRIVVIFHHTEILTAWEDGTIVLNTDGYHESPTTRAALEHALFLAGYRGWLKSLTLNGYKNTVLRLSGISRDLGWVDGIIIAPDHTVSGYAPLKTYRADKQARKEWRESAAEFKAVLPVLLAGVEAQGVRYHPVVSKPLAQAVYDPECWPALTRYLAYKTGYDAPTAWAYLDREATHYMRDVVPLA